MENDKVISLSKARKRAIQERKEKQASENRIKFGRTHSEKRRDIQRDQDRKTHIGNHKIDKDT